MKTLILGLGAHAPSRVRVGVEVARGLHAAVADPDVHIVEAEAGDLDLLQLFAGYDKAVVVDSIRVSDGEIGELTRLGLSDLELAARPRARGGAEYRATVDPSRTGGLAMPREISIYAIEVGDGVDRSGSAAEIMREAVPRLVAQIAEEEFGTASSEGDSY
jgi:hydrogenase maturation protease